MQSPIKELVNKIENINDFNGFMELKGNIIDMLNRVCL